MLAKLHTFSLLGIEAIPVDVEVDVSPGTIPKTILVGLPEAAVRESTAALVALHGLTGTASGDILQQIGTGFATRRAPDADKAGLWGGLLTGALGGLAADVAAGGLTFGAGAILGGIAGALGARKITQRYNEERGLAGGGACGARFACQSPGYRMDAGAGTGRAMPACRPGLQHRSPPCSSVEEWHSWQMAQ